MRNIIHHQHGRLAADAIIPYAERSIEAIQSLQCHYLQCVYPVAGAPGGFGVLPPTP